MGKANRFNTLEYIGPLFPPEYEPKGYKLGGITLSPLAEEMLWSCAHYYKHEIYWEKLLKRGNFYKCLLPELFDAQKHLKFPEDYASLFVQMQAAQASEKEDKAAYRKEHRKEIKEEKDKLKEQYGYALVDGKKVAIAGYMVEAPSVIITRGEDPRFGSWKYRVKPEDVTLNIVKGSVPKGWKGKVEHSPTSQWVFKYPQDCGRPEMDTYLKLPKKVNFAATTDIAKGNNDKKFDKTSKAIKSWKKIEKHILEGIKSKDLARKQAALVAWLISETGIRVGEQGRNLTIRADTKGATTLTAGNLTFKGDN